MHRDVSQEVLQDGFLLAVRQSQNLLSNHILDFFFFETKTKTPCGSVISYMKELIVKLKRFH